MRLRRWFGVGAAVTALVSGCSTTPEVVFGTADTSGPKITVPAGEVSAQNWPDACTLLSDAEITAILPQATDIKREAQAVHLWSMPTLNPDLSVASGTDMDLPRGGCDYRFTLPNEYSFTGAAGIKIVLPAVSDESAIVSYYDKERKDAIGAQVDLGSSWGAEDCFRSDESAVTSLKCRNGRFYFEVTSSTPSGVSDEDWRDKAMTQVLRTLAAKM